MLGAMREHDTTTSVLVNGCGVIWVASQTTTGRERAVEAGALVLIEELVNKPLFQPLEVGQRDPFRYKLRIAECALARLKQ